ncbi:hypothetical protein Tco_1434413, partial [Tanacetum coccineum]
MIGHTIDRCFELVGYPPGVKKVNVNQNNVNNAHIDDNKADHSKSIAHTLTSDQYQRLMSLLSDTGNASKSHASIARASQHITYCATFLHDIIDVTHLNLIVAHSNGTIEQVKQVRNFKLGNNLILKDVLVVPGYNDLPQNFLMRTGSKKGGLYFFDEDQVLVVLKRKIKGLTNTSLGPVISPESNEPCNDGGDCANIGNEFAPNKSTNEPRVITVDSVAREKDNTQHETLVSMYDLDSVDVTELAAGQTVRRTSRKHVLPSRYNDYVLNKNVKYGIDKVVNYANLSLDNYVCTTNLNKVHDPATYLEAVKDSRWVDAMNL